MYEEKSKRLDIDWKSLLIKLGVMLIVVFLLMWVISLFSGDKKKPNESNLAANLQTMQTVALEYFTGSRLPESVNGQKKITLQEMLDQKLLIEFRDQDNNTCDTKESFAEATKINLQDYTIKVKLVCGDKSDYVIDTITVKQDNIIADNPDDNYETPDDNNDNNLGNNDNNDSNNNSSNGSNNSNTIVNKPNNSTNVKPSNPTVDNSKPSKPSTDTPVNNTCAYGNKDYNSSYTLAYVIPGNCAVSKNDYYNAIYQSKVDALGVQEYRKLVSEIEALKNKTGANLVVASPIYSGVYNKANTGLVGYQITYIVKYNSTIIYEYYLNQNGSRKVIIDNRNSISNNNGNNNSSGTVNATSLYLNTSYLDLYVGDVSNTNLQVTPSNATVTWSSTNTSVATVSSTGVITARRPGTVLITAKSGSKSVFMTVKVRENSTLTLNRDSVSLYKEDTYKIGYSSNGAPRFSSSNSRVASVTSTGLVAAHSEGRATIYVTVGNIEKRLTVTVKKSLVNDNDNNTGENYNPPAVDRVTNFVLSNNGRKINFNVKNPEVAIGKTLRLNNSANYFNSRPIWSSTNPEVASVDQEGNVTGHKVGTALIYAADGKYAASYIEVKVVANNYISYNTTVFVNTSQGRRIDFNTANPIVNTSSILKLYAKANYANPRFTWTSSNTNVAIVDQEGNVTGYSPGTTFIYATDGNYASSYILVRVEN